MSLLGEEASDWDGSRFRRGWGGEEIYRESCWRVFCLFGGFTGVLSIKVLLVAVATAVSGILWRRCAKLLRVIALRTTFSRSIIALLYVRWRITSTDSGIRYSYCIR